MLRPVVLDQAGGSECVYTGAWLGANIPGLIGGEGKGKRLTHTVFVRLSLNGYSVYTVDLSSNGYLVLKLIGICCCCCCFLSPERRNRPKREPTDHM